MIRRFENRELPVDDHHACWHNGVVLFRARSQDRREERAGWTCPPVMGQATDWIVPPNQRGLK